MATSPDIWQKLSDVSGLLSGVLVALIGGIATYVLAQRQRRVDDARANRELAVHRVQTVQAFLGNLGSNDEREKEAALLAISALGDSELASKLAAIYGGEGSVAALSRIAALSTGLAAAQAEQSLSVLFDTLRRAVVRISARGQDGSLSLGSGFVVSPNRVVTTAHLIDSPGPGTSLTITSSDGTENPATVVLKDRDEDLALIEFDTSELPSLRLEDRPDRQLGFGEVTAIGYGDGRKEVEVRVGRVAGITAGPDRSEIITEDISMPGFSGAPALNNSGRVVGVVQLHDPERKTHLIPARVVNEFLLKAT